MAIIYSKEIESRKATTNVAGTGANYRIVYTVNNPIGQPIDSITAVISKVATVGEGEKQKEDLTRVGSAVIDEERNNNYMSIDKFSDVTLDDQEAIITKYFADVKSILTV